MFKVEPVLYNTTLFQFRDLNVFKEVMSLVLIKKKELAKAKTPTELLTAKILP